MTDDQRTPDLDAAIDATVRALTTVSDDAAADSLRRTRVALADAAPRRAGLGAWRWAAPMAALIVAALVARALWPSPPIEPPRVANALSPLPIRTVTPPAPIAVARSPRRTRIVREPRVTGTSTAAAPSPRRDPLADLVRAVQAIPEEAWTRGAAMTDVPIAPIAIAPLETPPITDAPSEPAAPGEP